MSLEKRIAELGNEKTNFSGVLSRLSAWDWTKAIASNAAGAALSGGLFGFGALNVLTTAASFLTANYLINRKKGFVKNEIKTDLNFSAAYTPLLSGFLGILDKYFKEPISWMMCYAAGMVPFTVVTNGIRHMIEKYSPMKFIKGVSHGELSKDIDYIIKDIPKSARSGAKAGLYLTGPVGASRYLLPRELLIASLFPLRAAYRYITGRDSAEIQQYKPSYFGMRKPYIQAA